MLIILVFKIFNSSLQFTVIYQNWCYLPTHESCQLEFGYVMGTNPISSLYMITDSIFYKQTHDE